MSISAQRFKFLDKETNIPIKDFTKLIDNSVYNELDKVIETSLSNVKIADQLTDALKSGLDELKSKIDNPEVLQMLKDRLNSVIDSLSNMDLPPTVNKILNSLKQQDEHGLKDFFKDALHIGSSFLCNNLDFTKLFMLGYSLNRNITSGLLIALLLSWLDRYCKGFTQEEMFKVNNKDRINMMFPYDGPEVTSDSAFGQFTAYYADYIKSNDSLSLPSAITSSQLLTSVLAGNISSSLSNLREAEITYSDRDNYVNSLTTALTSYSPGSTEHNNLLTAIGKLSNLPLVSNARRNKQIKYEHLSSKLGSYIKNLGKVKVSSVASLGMSAIEKSLFDKMIHLQSNSNRQDIVSRPNDKFNNYNFNSILPSITSDEETYLRNMQYESDSHRYNDLHPTTTVFMES
jgi:hypothetical protein